VVGLGRDDDPLVSAAVLGYSRRQVVGLRAGAGHHQVPVARCAAEGGQQLLGVSEDSFLQISGVGAQRGHLAVHGLDNGGVGMANGDDVVVRIEELVAVSVPEPASLAPDEVDGFLVEQAVGRAQ